MAAVPLIQVNPEASLQRKQISGDAFCIVVDDFLMDPDALLEFASQKSGDFSNSNANYPGVQLRISNEAIDDIYRFVRSRMSKVYGFMRGQIEILSSLAMATLPPDELHFMQRLCHIDPDWEPNRAHYACVLYLFHDQRLGGTSFFRWKAKDIVWKALEILRNDAGEAEEFLKKQFPTFREPPRYMTESNEIADLLCTLAPRFNRLVFYPGDIPHSGALTAPELLSDDPQKGRLMLNIFFSVLPKADPSKGN